MNLLEFIDSRLYNEWIDEPGLIYYVRKSMIFPGLIELANVTAREESVTEFGYWRFLKRYESTIPFTVENVFNEGLIKLYRQRGWIERDTMDVLQFASPLAVEAYGETDRFKLIWGLK